MNQLSSKLELLLDEKEKLLQFVFFIVYAH